MKKFMLICFVFATLFATDALWMRYPSISPDGMQIAFSYGGDIYVVPTKGGDARLLTSHVARDYAPIWSPDGYWIAFASKRFGNSDIFLIPSAGGIPRQLTFHSANDIPCDWHPDGNSLLFSASRLDDVVATGFPGWGQDELYSISLDGSAPQQLLSTPAKEAQYSLDGRGIYYTDSYGIENKWRKHAISSATHDLWYVDFASANHKKLTSFLGEDQNAIPSKNGVYYLSEASGSINVWHMDANSANLRQITRHVTHPVRFLSISNDDRLCYSYDGEIYTMEAKYPVYRKVDIRVNSDIRQNAEKVEQFSKGASDMLPSPSGKEVAFIVKGEVFVTATKYGTTRQISFSPEQERDLSWSHDGRQLMYSSERNGSWNIYVSKIVDEEDKYFISAKEIEESPILEIEAETFQAQFSPDDSLIAFLFERDELRVMDLAKQEMWTVLPADNNYSYVDGDIQFSWSPDGNYLAASFLPSDYRWMEDIAIINVYEKTITNLTESGYFAWYPQWSRDGSMIYAYSSEYGLRNHGGWFGTWDVFGFYVNDSTFHRSQLSKMEFELLREKEKEEKHAEDEAEEDGDAEEKSKDDSEKYRKKGQHDGDWHDWHKKEFRAAIDSVFIDTESFEDRRVRMSKRSARIGDAKLSNDGEILYFLAQYDGGYNLYKRILREGKTELVLKLNMSGGFMAFDSSSTNLFLMDNKGMISTVDLKKKKRKSVAYNAEMRINAFETREYLFEHVWRQVLKKFYVEDLHGTDWQLYKHEYAKFLPHINNNEDYAEMMSELLGELNASHTGMYSWSDFKNADHTYSLALFYDLKYEGDGLRVAEVVNNGPCDNAAVNLKAGDVIEKMNGESVSNSVNFYPILNRVGKDKVRLDVRDADSQEMRVEYVQAINRWEFSNLLYHRWIDRKEAYIDSLSGDRLGYVHVRGMNDHSFRKTYAKVFGRHTDKEGLIVDTRFNGGGNLTGELVEFLSGHDFYTMVPRGKMVGHEPGNQWAKPVVVVMGEANYSDAHLFPKAFSIMKLGKTVGMPVAGTGTAVWWENLGDNLVFGIPQVGIIDPDGKFLENNQLEPDVRVQNTPESVAAGKDLQLEKAIEVLFEEIDR